MENQLAIITVTHNSQKYLDYYFQSMIKEDIKFDQLILVDSGSSNLSYLKKYESYKNVQVLYEDNIGFCKANNLAYSKIKNEIKYVLFLNPDIYFKKNIIKELVDCLNNNPDIFAVTPQLLRFSIENGQIYLADEIDSSGIISTFHGKYYDVNEAYKTQNYLEFPEAICGAFMLCKREILDEITENHQVFLEKFYMYKEDIELCLRAAKNGYRCGIIPSLAIYHGRGWINRSNIAKWQKVQSARNEFYLLKYCNFKKRGIVFIYYLLKYIYVKYIER